MVTSLPTEASVKGIRYYLFLFLSCVEGLHSLIQQAENSSSIKGVSLCSVGPKVSHLFFADNSLLFCWENTQECATILDVLQKYEEASSQQINYFSALTLIHTSRKHQKSPGGCRHL